MRHHPRPVGGDRDPPASACRLHLESALSAGAPGPSTSPVSPGRRALSLINPQTRRQDREEPGLNDETRAVEAIERFTTTGRSLWSAALVPVGNNRLIIENTAHLPVRRVSSIAHELAQHLLEHPFDQVLLNAEKKCRQFDKVKEDQAKFLSGELLIPRQAARKAAFAGNANEEIAQRFGVSTQFAQMQMAGPCKFAERALAKQAAARR